MLEVGSKAPDFKLPDQNGNIHTLKEFKGKKVVLYFYPKDLTPGCTNEACSFRDVQPQLEEKGAVVIGVSKDSVQSHKKFETKHQLPFLLLADEDGKVIEAYDVWVEKNMYGRKYMGIERSTYVIDEKGIIVKAYQKVKPKDHGKTIVGEL